MSAPSSVLVVGASAAGLSVAEHLRHRGFEGDLTVLGAEPTAPYDRPPLSKQVLAGAWEAERARLRDEVRLSELDASFVLGDPAVGLDAAGREVWTASGRRFGADAVVVATGVRHRALPGQDELAGAHVLRTLGDSLALRADLLGASRSVVVGEGVLGAEVAATARAMGVDVTMVGPQPAPMAAQVGPLVSARLAELHASRGVSLRLGVGVRELVGDAGRVVGVGLDSGEVLDTDAVLVAVGAVPNTGWLAGSGLELADGVVCDSRCRAADGIYAVGDVARWWHDDFGRLMRLENRTNATQQALTVAGNVLGEDHAFTPVPYFWTDQHDVKIQMHGVLAAGAAVSVVDGSLDEDRFVARYERDGRVIGVLGWNMPKQSGLRRKEIVAPLSDPAGPLETRK
ncbi:NADPH-dependent 2,4-dienoyl-CoA reductase/sulfur reductase-like enzyme [Saccharopolyspora lacisalsi]|uniref:NADPH-dependent 2,4-dienoyl-CoA reductase/sulfur reductase-like enzyme n=1 Tax=Halosaccharopolyspora lacisalsi TaxID=1000566 RepID=A0A839E2V6_9PSEU|nr:FAD-dependent oxidoreductase [Halosaccharopolyspora lacisalsi]MBA8826085.1 NADPH-dependent 2,4-dienoyl-CoA reductase/sulfur reductase-like enzyme [Halosaccharopolyspora lacisalsi]